VACKALLRLISGILFPHAVNILVIAFTALTLLVGVRNGIWYVNKNLAIANRSHVSCAHNMLSASMITRDLEI